jgi:hypothetical protein
MKLPEASGRTTAPTNFDIMDARLVTRHPSLSLTLVFTFREYTSRHVTKYARAVMCLDSE